MESKSCNDVNLLTVNDWLNPDWNKSPLKLNIFWQLSQSKNTLSNKHHKA